MESHWGFLSSPNPSTLDLRLNRVQNVGEIKLYDTDLQFVNVFDLLGSAIEFDVVMDATLIVYDEDRYHNDESEATHQWFIIRCRGSLDSRLSGLEIYDIHVYDSRNRQQRPLSNALVPIIYKEDLEKEALLQPISCADSMGCVITMQNKILKNK